MYFRWLSTSRNQKEVNSKNFNFAMWVDMSINLDSDKRNAQSHIQLLSWPYQLELFCSYFFEPKFLSINTIKLGTLRLDYEYEIEYECDFSILVFRLHSITTHTHFIPWATLSTENQHKERGPWKRHWFEIRKSYSYSISYS